MAEKSKGAVNEIFKAPYVGRLSTIADWHREVGRVYRQMRRGEIPKEDGTRLTYVANVGAQLAKFEEELREAKRIAEALEQQRNPIPRLEAPTADAAPALAVDVLPAESPEGRE